MKKLILALSLLISMQSFAQFGTKNFIDQNYIEVTGTAEIELVPDMIYIKVLLREQDLKGRSTVTETEKKMMAQLKAIGIDVSKNVTIKDFSGQLRSKTFSKDVALNKEYIILVNDGKTAAKVFTELDKIQITNISIDRLDNSKMEEARRNVKINAIKIAKAKADGLAEAIGQKAGRAIHIAEYQYGYLPVQSNTISAAGYLEKDEETFDNLNFENLKVKSTISCKFELK
ncbi:MAG: SIMPL domain-containing protein [Niabella sp.]